MNTTPRLAILAFALLLLTVIGGAVILLAARPEPVHIVIQPPLPTATSTIPAQIQVYVTGAVNQPNQIVSLPYGSRVNDALAAVGGLTAAADVTRVNLAAIVRDGDQVHVFAVGEAGAPVETADGIATPPGGAVVYINTATREELEMLPGIGATLAERIIDARIQMGRFNSLEDLDAVPGIGAALLERLEGLISFE